MEEKEFNEIIEWAEEKGGVVFKAFMEILYKSYVEEIELHFEDETQTFSGIVDDIICFYNPRFPDFDLSISVGDDIFKSCDYITMEDFKRLSDTEYGIVNNDSLLLKLSL